MSGLNSTKFYQLAYVFAIYAGWRPLHLLLAAGTVIFLSTDRVTQTTAIFLTTKLSKVQNLNEVISA